MRHRAPLPNAQHITYTSTDRIETHDDLGVISICIFTHKNPSSVLHPLDPWLSSGQMIESESLTPEYSSIVDQNTNITTQECGLSYTKKEHVVASTLSHNVTRRFASNSQIKTNASEVLELSEASVFEAASNMSPTETTNQSTDEPASDSDEFKGSRNIHKRPKRCSECKLDAGRRSCIGYPSCTLCESRHGSHMLSDDWRSHQFLYWLQWIADLSHAFIVHPKPAVLDSEAKALTRMRLEFNLLDRLQEQDLAPRTVIFYPTEQHEIYRTDHDTQSRRPPAINLTQLDQVVLAEIWGPCLQDADKGNLSSDEKDFWTSVQLFTGYLSMLHHLPETLIQPMNPMAGGTTRHIAAELMCALIWRLQHLYAEILKSCQKVKDPSQSIVRPAVLLYCLEVMCCLLRNMKNTDWRVPQRGGSPILSSLETDINVRVEQIIGRIFSIECYLSGKYEKNRQWPHVPAVLQFARDYPTTRRFPTHCLIKVFDFDGVEDYSKSTQFHITNERQIFDILRHDDAPSSPHVETRFTSYVNDANHVVDLKNASVSDSTIQETSMRSVSQATPTKSLRLTTKTRRKKERTQVRRVKTEKTTATNNFRQDASLSLRDQQAVFHPAVGQVPLSHSPDISPCRFACPSLANKKC